MSGELTAWVLTDGKAGDEAQCLGITEALGLAAQVRRIAPRPPFTWAMPRGPIDPREAAHRPGSPIAPPFPDLVIASGRRAVPYLREVKRRSGGRSFTVFLKDPRIGAGAADLIWVQAHDALRGGNVLVTATAPHRLHQARLAAERAMPDKRLAHLGAPRVAVLIGGDSRHHRFAPADVESFCRRLSALAAGGAALMATASRRTPALLAQGARRIVRDSGGFWWDGSDANPYVAMLALADAVVVTADSTNMVGEAASTGRPVLVFEPSGGHDKINRFLAWLREQGIVHAFQGHLDGMPYQPLNSTPIIAQAIRDGLVRHRAGLPA